MYTAAWMTHRHETEGPPWWSSGEPLCTSTAAGTGSVSGQETKIPHAVFARTIKTGKTSF